MIFLLFGINLNIRLLSALSFFALDFERFRKIRSVLMLEKELKCFQVETVYKQSFRNGKVIAL